MYQIQYNSFSYLIEEIIFNKLHNSKNVFKEIYTKDKKYVNYFNFTNIALRPPMMQHEDVYMWPSDARRLKSNYASKLVANVVQMVDIIDINTKEVVTKTIGEKQNEVPIASLPIMVNSKYCTTQLRPEVKNLECPYDPDVTF